MKFKSEVQLEALNNAAVDTDKFLVSDSSTVKYRTGTQLLSDLGIAGIYVPYTGATGNVNLGTHTLSSYNLIVNHTSGSGVAASITKGGSGEALTVNKTSGSGNAMSVTGGLTSLVDLTLSSISNATTDTDRFIVSDGGSIKYRTGAQVLSDIGAGTVTSVAASAGTGISVSGSPITTSGTLTITNTDRGSSQNIFKNIAVSGQTTVVADSNNDTLTFAAGTNVSIATNATTDTITINSTDQFTGTVTSVATGGGLTGGPITTSGTISHADTSSQASVDNSNGIVIQDVTLDTYGHVTGLASVNLDGRYYTESEADSRFVNVTGDTMTGVLNMGSNGTYSHELKFVNNTWTAGIDYQNNGKLRLIDRSGSRESINFYLLNGDIEANNTSNVVTNAFRTSGNSFINGGNVGIGTTSPTSLGTNIRTLDIRGTSGGGVRFGVSGGSESTFFTIAAGGYLGTISNIPLYFQTNNTVKATILANGNVGIGTTSPAYTLDVNGSLHSTSLTIADAIYHEGDTNTYIQFVANDTIRWVTSGSERMRLNSSGDLGIGTSSITTNRKLDVNGNALVRSNLYIGPSGGSASSYSLEIGQGRSGNGAAFIDLSGDATYGGDFSLRIIRGSTGANATSQIIHRGTGAFSIETWENANILLNPGSGRVGIGSSNPGNKLYVTDSRAGANAPADLAAIHGYNSSTDTSTANSVGVAGTSLTTSGKAIYGNAPNGGWGGYFNGKGFFDNTVTATNFILSSDKTLKDNISDINTDHVDVKWKNFELKSEPGVKRAGVVAQELEEKHPEFVRTDKDGIKSVAYIDLLIAKIAELEARLEKLEK